MTHLTHVSSANCSCTPSRLGRNRQHLHVQPDTHGQTAAYPSSRLGGFRLRQFTEHVSSMQGFFQLRFPDRWAGFGAGVITSQVIAQQAVGHA